MTNKLLLSAFVLASIFCSGPSAQSKPYQGTLSGTLSDSMCKGRHASMIKAGGYGSTDASCIRKCLKEGYKLVFVDRKNMAVYLLQGAKNTDQLLGKKVSVIGHIDTTSKIIHVHHIKAAK
jgi:hypothetical protein